MKPSRTLSSLALALLFSLAAARGDGYYGYKLSRRGDDESAIYETEGTTSGVAPLDEEPDVYLNASVSVGEISIEVENITAKINLDAKVLNLLNFNAGVDASIDRVKLGIYNVTAKVELEARLGNVLRMVGDVLDSIDLNPIIATLGDGITDIVDGVGDAIGGTTDTTEGEDTLAKRDLTFRLDNNILYSVNNFQGSKHRNRILAQNGDILDVFLDNQGNERTPKVVGYYSRDMTFTGHNQTIPGNGKLTEFELQYKYEPYLGLIAYCNIYISASGNVVRTKVVAEAEGGGSATIEGNDEI